MKFNKKRIMANVKEVATLETELIRVLNYLKDNKTYYQYCEDVGKTATFYHRIQKSIELRHTNLIESNKADEIIKKNLEQQKKQPKINNIVNKNLSERIEKRLTQKEKCRLERLEAYKLQPLREYTHKHKEL